MANQNFLLQLLITAKDEASSVMGKLFTFLDSKTSVVAEKVRGAFAGLFNITDDAAAFEAQLSRVQSKANASAADMERLKQAALGMGKQMGVSAIDAAQGLEILTGAGLSVDDAITALLPTLQVMSTEQVSADVAARALTDSLTIMGVALNQTGRAGDVLQAGADATSTSVTMLADALRSGGSAAVSAGLSFEQTVALLTAFAKAGIQGSEAGTALGAVLGDLTNPTSAARAELAKLGLTTGDVGALIDTLVKAGPKGSEALRAFTEAAGPGLNALLQVGRQGLADYTAQMEQANGGLARAADTIGNNTLGALGNLKAAWEQLKLSLSTPLLEPIAKGAKALATRLNELAQSGVLQQLGQGLAGVFVTAGNQVADFLGKVDWAKLEQQASEALASLRSSLAELVADLKTKTQAIRDWTTVAFSPVTTAIDGFRLAVALGKGDTEKFNQVLAGLSERTNAWARVLGLATDATRENTAAGKENRAAQQQTATVQQQAAAALEDAKRQVQAYTEALAQATPGTGAYAYYAELLQQAQQDLAKAQEQVTQTLRTQTPEQVKAAAASAKTAAGSAEITKTLQEYERQIKAATTTAGAWRSGLELNNVTLLGLRDAAQATAEKLAYLRSIQAQLPDADRQIATAAQAAAQAQDLYTKALDENVTQQERAIEASQRQANLTQQAAEVTLNRIQAELELARIKGDVNEQSRLEDELFDAHLAKQDAAIAAKQQEIAAYNELIEATQRKLEADGALDASDRAQLAQLADKQAALELERQGLEQTRQATEEKAQAEKAAAATAKQAAEEQAAAAAAAKAHAEQTQAAGNLVTGVINGWLERLQALSPAAEAAFRQLRGMSDAAQTDAAAVEQARAAHEALSAVLVHQEGNSSTFIKWINETAVAAREVEARFWDQAVAAERLTAQLVAMSEGGKISLYALRQAQMDVQGGFDLLDQTRLDHLQQAIEAATQKMEDLRQASLEALDAAQRALLQEQGDQAALARLDFERTQLELQQQINAARASGDADAIANLQKALALEQKAYDLKLKKLKAEQDANAAGGATASSQSGGGRQSGGGISPGKTYTLNLINNNKTLTATTATDPAVFLETLEHARKTSMGG